MKHLEMIVDDRSYFGKNRKTVQLENVVSFKKKLYERRIANLRTGHFCVTHGILSDKDSVSIMRDQQKHFPTHDVYQEGDDLEIIELFQIALTTSRDVKKCQ